MTSGNNHINASNDGVHQLWYLGNAEMAGSSRCDRDAIGEVRSIEERLIDRCETAQMRGELAVSSRGRPLIAVHVSKHGVKMTNVADESVIDRLALHSIVQTVAYDDGFGNANVVLRVKKPTANDVYLCYLFQARNANDADHLCKQLRQVFNSVVR